VTSLHAAGNLVDELSSTVVLADMWLAAGRPSTARRLYERALRTATELGERAAKATPDLLVGLSELDYEIDDLEAATRHLDSATALGEAAGMTESRYRWFVARGRVASAEGDLPAAIAHLDTAEELYLPGFFPAVRPIAAIRARVWISHGHLAQAARWARERGVAATDEAEYLSEFDHLTLIRLILAQHRVHADPTTLDQAADLLARLHAAAETSGRGGSLVEIQLLLALVQDAQGHRAQARQTLADARARTPEPDGYVRLFLDEGAPLGELTGQPTSSSAGRSIELAGEPSEPLNEPLSERELQVLRLLDSELTGPEIARELFVTLNTLRSHTKRIFTKLEVTSRRAAVARARERGLL